MAELRARARLRRADTLHGRVTMSARSIVVEVLIAEGRGIWIYEPREESETHFKTVYDYRARFGLFGRVLDIVFRRVLQLATEWGFETLRRWCEGDERATDKRRSRWRFAWFCLGRMLGRSPRPGEARSWLGSAKAS